jgi:Ca-activated chloride channel homolog
MIGSATGIAPPIASGVKRLKDSESKRKLLVLFTDGSNTANSKITPIQAAKLGKHYDVTIYTVGIGSNRAYVPQMTPFGMRFLESGGGLDEKLLKEIAKETDGLYYTAADGQGLEKAMEEINSMEKTSVEHTRWMNYSELSPKLIQIALGIMLLAFLLENSIMLRVP